MYSFLLTFLNEEQANLIICLLSSIPLSYLLSLIHQRYIFLALSISVTLAFQSFLFPTERYFLWAQQQIVFVLIKFLAPRKMVGHVVLIESFIALGLIQIRRMYLTYAVNGFDITGIFMMQTFVWVGMAYNYQNGSKPQENLTEDAKKRAISECPDYATYLGYVNFLPACLIGPVYEFRDFEDYLNRRGDFECIPNQLWAVGQEFLIFIGTVLIYLASVDFPLEFVLTEEFNSEYNLLQKMIYIMVNITHLEFKYISAWSLGMVAMHASGFTYNPKLNKAHSAEGILEHRFDRVQVTGFVKYFVRPSVKEKAEGWNMSVQVALRKYIYEQIYNQKLTYSSEKQRNKTMTRARIATFMVSAIWHGFYLGYFMTFFHWALCAELSTEFYKFRTKNQRAKELWEQYPFLVHIENCISTFSLYYFGMAFHLMIYERIIVYIKATYAIPYILLYVTFFLIVKMKILREPTKGDKLQKQK